MESSNFKFNTEIQVESEGIATDISQEGLQKPVITGSLVANDYDDDSESGDDREDEEYVPEPPLNIPFNIDHEEDLEVNPEVELEPIRKKEKAIESSQQSELPNRLADAMTIAVEEVLIDSPSNKYIKKNTMIEKDEDDCFGIKYQSTRKRDNEKDVYELNSSMEFAEMEHELSSSEVQQYALHSAREKNEEELLKKDDDEFEYQFEAQPSVPLNSISYTKQDQEDDTKILMQKLKEEAEKECFDNAQIRVEGNQNQKSNAEGENVNEEESWKNSLVKSLSEINNAYKRGLGDQDTLLMDDKIGKKEEPKSLAELKGIDTVIEENEEEAEEEEAEADGDEKKRDRIEKEEMNEEILAWAQVDQLRESETKEEMRIGVGNQQVSISSKHELIDCNQAFSFLCESTSLKSVLVSNTLLVEEVPETSSCLSCIFGSKGYRLHFEEALNQRKIVFGLAQVVYREDDEIHHRMLQTVYKHLTGIRKDSLSHGKHWESIGFQGDDPASDFRGVGVLGLYQLLHLVLVPQQSFVRKYFQLSQHEQYHFPFACVSLNITLACIKALRSTLLVPVCNMHQSVYSAFHLLHVAACFKIYKDWCEKQGQEAFPFVLKEVLELTSKQPRKIIQDWETYLSSSQNQTNNNPNVPFTSMEEE